MCIFPVGVCLCVCGIVWVLGLHFPSFLPHLAPLHATLPRSLLHSFIDKVSEVKMWESCGLGFGSLGSTLGDKRRQRGDKRDNLRKTENRIVTFVAS